MHVHAVRVRPIARLIVLRRFSPTTPQVEESPLWALISKLPSRVNRNRQPVEVRGADFLEIVDRHVQLGSSLRGAVVRAADECSGAPPALRVLLLHCRTGAPLDSEEVVADTSMLKDDDAFLVRSVIAAGAGGPAASFALQRAAWALRERQAIRLERRTYASQAVFSARVLSWLPVVFGVVMAVTNRSVRSVYLGGPAGIACLTVGLLLNVAGRRWMQKVTCSFD